MSPLSKNIPRKGPQNCRSLRYATPNFLLRLVALMSFMRLSLMKAAHVALSGAAKQEIRVRSGRDDKGERNAFVESGCWTEGVFHPHGFRIAVLDDNKHM
jgi:hypothetical protein